MMSGGVLVIMLGRIWGVFVMMVGPKSITQWRNLGRRNHLQMKRALARFLGAEGLAAQLLRNPVCFKTKIPLLLVFPLAEFGMGLGLVLGVGLGLGSGSGLGLNFGFLAFGVAEKSVPCPASLCEKAS